MIKKRIAISIFVLIAVTLSSFAQVTMRINLNDGKQIDVPVGNIESVTWVSMDGVSGCKVTSKQTGNKNFIFLPAAGYKGSGTTNNKCIAGNYWCASSFSDYPDLAYVLNFVSNSFSRTNGHRYLGFPVRAVCP